MRTAEWISLVVYIIGWLVTCRVIAKYFDDVRDMGLFMLGFVSLWWPALAAIGLFVLPVWLITRDLD